MQFKVKTIGNLNVKPFNSYVTLWHYLTTLYLSFFISKSYYKLFAWHRICKDNTVIKNMDSEGKPGLEPRLPFLPCMTSNKFFNFSAPPAPQPGFKIEI